MAEINPVNKEGNQIKRRGLFVRNADQLLRFCEVMNNAGTETLLKGIEELNGETKREEQSKVQI